VLDLVDCEGAPADGLHVELVDTPDNRALYFEGPLPTRDVSGTVVSSLGRPPQEAALAGFMNVEPGFVTVRLSLEGSGQHVTYVTLQARPQTMTLTRFKPGSL
jgi:hypothetical protein